MFLVYKAAANRKRARLLGDTPVTKIAELGFGLAQVQGRVVAFSEPLAGPLSGRPCVYYLIEEGDDLLVLGQWETAPSGAWQFGKGGGPYIVSNQSQGALLSSYKGFAWLWSILAVLVLVVPCLPLGLRLWLH